MIGLLRWRGPVGSLGARVVHAFLLALFLLSVPRRALAQDASAETLFEQGRQALAAGDLETACTRFRASDKIDPAPGTKANLADCEEKRGKIATALEVNRTALGQLPASDPRGAILKQRIAALEPRLPKVVLELVVGAPVDTIVREGDATLGSAGAYGVAIPLDPGKHRLVITALGRVARIVEVTLTEGRTESLKIEPAAVQDVSVGAAQTEEPEAPRSPSPGRSQGPWVVGGIGVAALVIGVVTGSVLLQKKGVANAHCTDGPPPTCKDQTGLDAASAVRTLGPVTTVALVAGAAGVAAGGLWLGLRGSEVQAVKVGIGPMAKGATWRVEGSW